MKKKYCLDEEKVSLYNKLDKEAVKNSHGGQKMDIIEVLQKELQVGRHQVEAAVKLIDEGNTIPFIARYRKEATGSLNDEVLRS